MNKDLPNYVAACSMLVASSAGCFAFGLLYLLGNSSPAINRLLGVYPPSGALSGVLVFGTLIFLLSWAALSYLWSRRPPSSSFAVKVALVLLGGGLLLTFPPLVRLL
ncbi:hypothetical protein [Edaphobacter sp. 12200R-103]|jgi:hypothetical protein|uniref:hypothetical protein n=1 Tax=Edaphobacter sp. 12200R-103 TaxID=2703788 RepID=UPI00138D47FD|nr:hypothetical protein [Edaphobacter sp. 12200R-103]QHS52716.1 hypothetical protein GWR55_14055 [Edaphobacter sp. 12200R-103]